MMLTGKLRWLPLAFCLLCVTAHGQERKLEPGKAVEREVSGGESHTYQISLAAGQFARFRLEQRAIDSVLILTAPDGKQMVETNLTGVGDEESLSLDALTAGIYKLMVRAIGVATRRGSYELETTFRTSATEQDRKRLTAEALLREVKELGKPSGKTTLQAIEKIQQALTLWRELGEPPWTAHSLWMFGDVYRDTNQFEKAIEYYEQLLVFSRQFKLRAKEGIALGNLGISQSGLNHPDKAIEYQEQALAIKYELKDLYGQANILLNLGNSHVFLSRYEKAIECYERGRAINREMGDRAGEAMMLRNLGIANMGMNRTETAIGYYEQALSIHRDLKNRASEAQTIGSLGTTYFSLSRYEKAIEYFEQSVAISRELKNRQPEANTLNNLGVTYQALNRYEKSIEYIEQALAIFRELKLLRYEGQALGNLGLAYNSLGDYEKAIEYQEQALAIAREGKNRSSEGRSLGSLGLAYKSLNRYEKAIEYSERSLAIAREVKDRDHEQQMLHNLGETYLLLGRFDDAARYLEQSVLIAREDKVRANEASALSQLAVAESKRGNLLRARTLVEQSLGIAESLRTYLVSPESRAGFLATVQSSYQLYTDLLMRQHQAEPTKGLDALAVEVSERQRARSLLDLLSEARADIRQGVDATLIERERTLAKQLNDKARMQTSTPQQAAALKQEISQLENDYERAQVAIRKANPRYAALTQPQPLKLKEIQQQLDADTLLLEYALGDERSYLWAISKDSLVSYELPKEELIRQNALQVHELLSACSTSKRGETAMQRQQRITQAEANLPAAARQLSQTLLSPVAAQIGNKRLVIVADGALQYIPFAMLPDPVVGKTNPQSAIRNPQSTVPLIVNHEIVSLPSASALAIQRTELAGRQPAPKMLAVIADPVFDRTDVRFTTPATEVNEKQQAQTITSDDARSIEHLAEKSDDKSSLTTRRMVIPRLPFTRQEATRLLALTPMASSFQAMDFQANRETVLKGDLSQYRYVHFATHGVLDSERPGLSSLVLSMVNAQGKPQDGFLRANDIYNLKLPAELVVLSACQTGLGKEIKGEGLVGLTRGFMYAGAARVVVSLWSVNDKATAELMTKFYQKMLKQGERPAAALRAAQVEMWRQKQWQSPYYWAAFTMQGEWR